MFHESEDFKLVGLKSFLVLSANLHSNKRFAVMPPEGGT